MDYKGKYVSKILSWDQRWPSKLPIKVMAVKKSSFLWTWFGCVNHFGASVMMMVVMMVMVMMLVAILCNTLALVPAMKQLWFSVCTTQTVRPCLCLAPALQWIHHFVFSAMIWCCSSFHDDIAVCWISVVAKTSLWLFAPCMKIILLFSSVVLVLLCQFIGW